MMGADKIELTRMERMAYLASVTEIGKRLVVYVFLLEFEGVLRNPSPARYNLSRLPVRRIRWC
jgi:hypothetical protein